MNRSKIKFLIFIIYTIVIVLNFELNYDYSQSKYRKNEVLAQGIKSTFNTSTAKGIIDENSERFVHGRYFNCHTFEGTKNSLITIEMNSENFEPNFMLVDSNWKEIEVIIFPINKSKYRALLKLPYTGTYKVLATSNYFGKTGQYNLNWRVANREDILRAKVVFDAIEEADRLSRESFQLDQEVKREQAIPIAKKAIEIYRQQLGSRNPYIAAKLINFGLLYDNLIRYSEAESIYLEALEINRETLGSRHPKVALNLNSLAILYESQGRYSEAELLYIEALEIDREQLEPFHSAIATALSNLAGLYYHQGRYDEMKPLLEESILIREELNDELGLSYSFGWLAFMYKAQHNYDEAVKLTKKTLNIVRKHRGERHNAYAIDLNNLGLLYNAQGRYSEAEPLFKQALDIYREVLELRERDTNFATSLNSLGKSYHYQRKYIEAESSYNQALEIFREQLGDKHPDTALSFNNLAELHLTQENSQQAIEFLTQGIQIEEYNISENLIPGSEKQKRDYIAKVSASTDLAISLNLHSVSNNSKATNLALTTILQRKGRILDILTNSLKILRRQTHNPETQKLLTDYYNLNNQYSNLVFQKPEDIESFDIHRQQLIELENQTKQLEDQLSRRSAEFRELTEPVTLEKIQQLIPQDSALVELVRYKPFNPQESANKRWGEPRYAAYILHSEGNPQAIDLGEAEPIDKAVDQFRKTLCTTTEPTKSSIENCIKNLPIEQVKSSAQKRPLA